MSIDDGTEIITTVDESTPLDPRLADPAWGQGPLGRPRSRVLVPLVLLNAVAAVWYIGWLLEPSRVGNPWLYGILIAAESFNLIQAAGFWWTVHRQKLRESVPWIGPMPSVDVLVPTYNEPVGIVEPVLAAIARLHGGPATMWLLDDGDRVEMSTLAAKYGANYLAREGNEGAKAGNINHALPYCDGEFVLILDCDHVPHPDFLTETLGHFGDEKIAFVQTPQHYANAETNPIAAASWSQQALFFGAIARGKDRSGAMFCCGTNVVFRRTALDDVGGFPTNSVTEDFQLSIKMHERGWRSAYVAQVLAQGLGPEDMASYTSQQLRWARGCLTAVPAVLSSRLPWRLRAQYLFSAMYFLTGWTVLAYMIFPIVRILSGEQPLAAATADKFLIHFAPYFALALLTVAVAGGGRYTFAAYTQAAATFWIHVAASIKTALRLPGRFVVTPKEGAGSWQPRAVWPSLVMIVVLSACAVYGLIRVRDAAMVNNVAFAALHVVVLSAGVSTALSWRKRR